MRAHQQVFRVRRNYNKWVANQTLEDYALRFTAKRARKWSMSRVSNTALGAISFLALEAIGGAITLNYGFTNSVAAICTVGLIIFLTGIPISYYASRYGIDIDLLTRGASFGYIGSTITSLIYASFTFIFFAIEAAIMAMALLLTLNIPLGIGYFISALVVIPLVTHGITLISRFQLWSQPVWVVLQLLPLIFIVTHDITTFESWTQYEVPASEGGHFNLLLFGAAASVVFSLIAQIGEQVDFLRFLPPPKKRDKKWYLAFLAAGPGWIVIGVIKILIGSFLAWLAVSHGVGVEEASDPTRMYMIAFSYITQSPNAALILAGVFVVISQLKINVTNAYAGSIAWSNFFSRLTHNHPGRVVWLVFNVTISLMLMELGIYQALEEILGVYAIVALAWVGSLVADLIINKPLKLRPAEIEFKRAHLYDINPVGVGSMLIASIAGIAVHTGLLGDQAQALSSFITLGLTFTLSPLLAWLTKGRYYIARPPVIFSSEQESLTCCICEHHFEKEDMTFCPAYDGPICSLCCSLDARCDDVCKTNARFSDQFISALSSFLPQNWVAGINSKVATFIGLFFITSAFIASLLLLIYLQIRFETNVDGGLLFTALWKVSFILLIISGVLTWMFVLMHDSRRVAHEESIRQTQLLVNEIAAHQETDLKLQKAKEVAEAANQAKSRYLTGISHELRTPLNAVLGYAQLLEKDEQIPQSRKDAIGIIRHSGEYLADLIEGLLDISKIEAGKLDLHQTEVRLPSMLEQIVSMFTLQAQAKGIGFEYICNTHLPEYVKTDEKRLRQILINLLSNAVKYTNRGKVIFKVKYRSQVAEFIIQDTGIGINDEDLERIFKPFERVCKPGVNNAPGTGLGLTITRLLTDIMGGDIQIDSKPGQGSTFHLSLMLSSIFTPTTLPVREKQIEGYEGEPKIIMVVDDDPAHRALIRDTLVPLGFRILEAQDGQFCLEMIEKGVVPDLYLLDVSMPGISGWALAEKLRNRNAKARIIMVSANAKERDLGEVHASTTQDYLVKPIKLTTLLSKIGSLLNLSWQYQAQFQQLESTYINYPLSQDQFPPTKDQEDLIRLANIGYAQGIKLRLQELEDSGQGSEAFFKQMRQLLKQFNFGEMKRLLGEQTL